MSLKWGYWQPRPDIKGFDLQQSDEPMSHGLWCTGDNNGCSN